MMCQRYGGRTQARVLVADWDRNHALTLTAILHRAGFYVATAFNGKEAVAKAEIFRPDLLLTEAYMGRLSGIQAAARITAALPDCRVLFLCGEASADDVAMVAPRDLVYSFTSKPIHSIDLLHTIAYLLSAEWSTDDSALTDCDAAQLDTAVTAVNPGINAGVTELATVTKTRVTGAILQHTTLL